MGRVEEEEAEAIAPTYITHLNQCGPNPSLHTRRVRSYVVYEKL
jgi:hypothetical protein